MLEKPIKEPLESPNLRILSAQAAIGTQLSNQLIYYYTVQFLVRDWQHPGDFAHGSEGGKKMIKEKLKVSENQRPEQKQLREHINSCFGMIDCFLMPYPGKHFYYLTNPGKNMVKT